MLCNPCSQIQINVRGAEGHERLTQQRLPEKRRISGQSNIFVTKYRCSTCGTLWTYTDDRKDEFSGWERY